MPGWQSSSPHALDYPANLMVQLWQILHPQKSFFDPYFPPDNGGLDIHSVATICHYKFCYSLRGPLILLLLEHQHAVLKIA